MTLSGSIWKLWSPRMDRYDSEDVPQSQPRLVHQYGRDIPIGNISEYMGLKLFAHSYSCGQSDKIFSRTPRRSEM
jgi:hypothetical protein